MSKRKILLEGATYAVALFLCILVIVWVAHLWDADLSVPLCFEEDALFYHALIKGIIENGWVLHNRYIGVPAGLDLYDLPMTDNLNFGLIKVISYFAPTSAATLNIFALLTFPLITVTALSVFRYFNLSRPSSIVASLLFAFLPYHFMRLGGHTLLSAYYAVPLATMIILWAFSEEPIFFRYDEVRKRNRLSILNRKALVSIAVCLVVASTGIYYAFFACFFLLVAAICHLLTRHKLRITLSAAVLILLISGGVLVNLSPNLSYRSTHGSNPQAAHRSPVAAEVYGLKITQLVLPSDNHRVAPLRKFKARYNRRIPSWNENTAATLGIVGTLGFLILFARLFGYKRRTSEPDSDLPTKLSILNMSAVLLGTIGGFGSLFAYTVSPQIRAYNRISVYIAFFAIMAFFLSFEGLSQKFQKTKKLRFIFNLLLAFVLTVGILDQTPSFYPTGMTDRSFQESYQQEADFIRGIEAIMPSDAMIFQLPYVPCPENPPVNRMDDYDHLRAYLHSESLRWSYGAMKGRMTDGWQKTIAAKPVEEFVAILSLSGFNGIYVDRFGYPDTAADLEGNLSRLLTNKPLVSPDKRLVFFSLSEFNKKTIEEREALVPSSLLPVWGEGFSDLEDTHEGRSRSCSSEGKLYIYNISNRPRQATLEMTLATKRDNFSNLRIESPLYSGNFKVNRNDMFFSRTVRVPPGTIVVRFKSDDRNLRVMNFRLREGQEK